MYIYITSHFIVKYKLSYFLTLLTLCVHSKSGTKVNKNVHGEETI